MHKTYKIKKLLHLVFMTWLFIQGMIVSFVIVISGFKWFSLLLDIATGIATKDDYLLFFVMNCFYSVMYFYHFSLMKMSKKIDPSKI
jgi:hypothetical protein